MNAVCRYLFATIMLLTIDSSKAWAETSWDEFIAQGTRAYEKNHYAEAETSWSAALRYAVKAGTPEMLATSQSDLALLYTAQHKYAKAEPLYKHALQIREKLFGANHKDVGASLNDLALLYDAQGKYAEAEPLYKRSLTISEKASGQNSADTAQVLTNLASLYREQGKYAQAEPLYKRVLQVCDNQWGPKNPLWTKSETCASCMEDYALLLSKTQRKDEAHKLNVRAKSLRATQHAKIEP